MPPKQAPSHPAFGPGSKRLRREYTPSLAIPQKIDHRQFWGQGWEDKN
jgi:hypothetical protein